MRLDLAPLCQTKMQRTSISKSTVEICCCKYGSPASILTSRCQRLKLNDTGQQMSWISHNFFNANSNSVSMDWSETFNIFQPGIKAINEPETETYIYSIKLPHHSTRRVPNVRTGCPARCQLLRLSFRLA